MVTTSEILKQAKALAPLLAAETAESKNNAIIKMAESLMTHKNEILAANKIDVDAARGKVSDVMLDRLMLDESRIMSMADGMCKVKDLADPVGRVLSTERRENGLVIKKVSVPMGVVAIIYESRPNVTSDAAVLAMKSGNVCVLRSGKEAFNSSYAIVKALRNGLSEAGFPEGLISIVEDTTRQSATELMTAQGYVDLLIPRGGAGLIRACVENAKVPCIQTGTGICHIYVDKSANLLMALSVISNAKTSRPSVCNAEEVLLLHKDIAKELLPKLKKCLCDDRARSGLCPVELRLDERAAEIIKGTRAKNTDFDTEFLDYILAVAVVDGTEDAIKHIALHSTGHSEAIITEDSKAADMFKKMVDSAAVYVNASTRFTDGGEFGLGCEMGISTQKLHARGPMGLCELNSYKYIIEGTGQIR